MLVLSIDHRDASAADHRRPSAGHRRRWRGGSRATRRCAAWSALGTCARVEVYLDAARFHDAHRIVVDTLAATAGLSTDHVAALTRSYRGLEGLEHLFRVATGLESAVVGEVQIGGQVRDALADARANGTTTRSLDMAFENAMRVSRLARERLDADDASIVSGGPRRGGPGGDGCVPRGRAGHRHRRLRAGLRRRGAQARRRTPSSCTRRPGGASRRGSPITSCRLTSCRWRSTLADVVVGASGHGVPVVTEAHVEQAMNGRAAPLVLVDLAGAGDVSPTVDAHPDVLLVRIDDVRRRAIGSDAASSVVSREAAMLHPRIEGREVDDVIVALRQHIESIAGVDESVDPAVAEAVRRITRTILHTPTVRAREAAQSGDLERYRSALETVFGIEHRADADAFSRGSAA